MVLDNVLSSPTTADEKVEGPCGFHRAMTIRKISASGIWPCFGPRYDSLIAISNIESPTYSSNIKP
jgi:hypothetical protein